MNRPTAQELTIFNEHALETIGLSREIVASGIIYTYRVLDIIDSQLIEKGIPRLSKIIELTNLSSMIGNLIGSGIADASNGGFKRNRPHAYPDLLAQSPGLHNVEVKIAYEDNAAKSHLAKSGYYLIFRYVLCDEQGKYDKGSSQGEIVWIWEVRIGYLGNEHFAISNTPDDSGKTAVISADSRDQMNIIFCDLDRCPYSMTGRTYKKLKSQHPDTLKLVE